MPIYHVWEISDMCVAHFNDAMVVPFLKLSRTYIYPSQITSQYIYLNICFYSKQHTKTGEWRGKREKFSFLCLPAVLSS